MGWVVCDECYLRYDDHAFSEEILSEQDTRVCGSREFNGYQTIFKRNVADLVKNLSAEGAQIVGYSLG